MLNRNTYSRLNKISKHVTPFICKWQNVLYATSLIDLLKKEIVSKDGKVLRRYSLLLLGISLKVKA